MRTSRAHPGAILLASRHRPGELGRPDWSITTMRAFGVLLFVLVAGVAGVIGYQAGLTSSAAAAGATVVVTGGFPGIGTLLFLLFLGFLFFAFAGRRRAGWGPGHGHGPWGGRMGPGDPSDPRRRWVAEMHRRLHEEEAQDQQTPNAPPAV
jgi:hypothetical protein